MKVGQANYWNDPESFNSAQEVGPMMVCQREPLVNHQANGVIIKYWLCSKNLISLAQAMIGSYVCVRLAMIFDRYGCQYASV